MSPQIKPERRTTSLAGRNRLATVLRARPEGALPPGPSSMAMASPPRRSGPSTVTPPFTPLRSPAQRRAIEEKVARQLAALPGPDEELREEEEQEVDQRTHGQQQAAPAPAPVPSLGATELFPASPVRGEGTEGGGDGGGGGDDDGDDDGSSPDADDAMLQYLGSVDDVSDLFDGERGIQDALDGSSEDGEEDGEEAAFDVGTLGRDDATAPPASDAHPTASEPASLSSPSPPPADRLLASGPTPSAERRHSVRASTPRLSAVASAVPALFTGCDPVRMRQQISLLTRQVQRGEDTIAALHARVAQARADRDSSELSNVEHRERADAVRQHLCLLKAQVQQLSGVQAPTLEELRGNILHQAQTDTGLLARKLAEQEQLVRQLQTQLEDQQISDTSEHESLQSEVERCASHVPTRTRTRPHLQLRRGLTLCTAQASTFGGFWRHNLLAA